MGLSSIKRGDESGSPDDDGHGFGRIGLILGSENRNGKQSQQCAKQSNSTIPEERRILAQFRRTGHTYATGFEYRPSEFPHLGNPTIVSHPACVV